MAALFCIGGLVAFLHKKEHDLVRLFELGIIAPALLTSVINGANATRTENQNAPVKQPEVTQESKLVTPHFGLVSAAFAQQPSPTPSSGSTEPPVAIEQRVKTFSPPEETASEQLLRGLFGSTSKRVWCVVVGSYSSLENAMRHAEKINKRNGEFSAEVYKSAISPYYMVVIGTNLTLKDATALKEKARASGLPRDTYILKPALSPS